MAKSGQLRSDAVPRERVIAMRLLRIPATQIARELGIRHDSLSRILAEPDVMAEIAEAEAGALEDAKATLVTLTRKAARVIAASLDSSDERIALDAAKTLLTKAGADAPSKSESKNELSGKDGAALAGVAVVVTEDEMVRLAARKVGE